LFAPSSLLSFLSRAAPPLMFFAAAWNCAGDF